MFNKMKTFNMYVKTVIYGEHDKILLLKQKRDDEKQVWDLPGATFTEEQSFDETVTTNVQKEIGYYVYPGKIIGIGDYTSKTEKDVYVIMDGTILNGELLLSKDYETYTWVTIDRIKDYPLVPWLNNYMHDNRNPFEDVEAELEELTKKRRSRREFIQEDLISSFGSRKDKDRNKDEDEYEYEYEEEVSTSGKSSFSLLKDTIIRTFHPREAKVTRTTPKTNEIYQESDNKKYRSIEDRFNFRKKKEEPADEYLEKAILEEREDDIIIEHDDADSEATDIIIDHNDTVTEDIIIDHSDDSTELKEQNTSEAAKDNETELNADKEEKLKVDSQKTEPMIKIIRKNEKAPLIRKEKETKKVSFNSDNISSWKERLNRINRTEANDEKKKIPRPKGKR